MGARFTEHKQGPFLSKNQNSLVIGVLVGNNHDSFTTSYNTGSVNGIRRVGGLVGYNSGSITVSYRAGTVSGNKYVAGLVGWPIPGSSVTSSFWDVDTSVQATSPGSIGRTGKTTAVMQMASSLSRGGSVLLKRR